VLVVFLLPLKFLLCLQWRYFFNLATTHWNGYFCHVFGLCKFVFLIRFFRDFTLFVFFNSIYFVVLVTIWAFSLFFFHLEMVTFVANLILAITRIEFLLMLFEVILAYVADVWSSSYLFLRLGIVKILLFVHFLFLICWLWFGSVHWILCLIRLLRITYGRLIILLLIIVLLWPLLMLDQIILLMVIIVFTVILILGSRILNLLISTSPTLLILRGTSIWWLVVILVLVVISNILRVRVLLVPQIIVELGCSGSRVWFLMLILSTMVQVNIALFPAIKFWWIGFVLLILSLNRRWPIKTNRSRGMAMIYLLLGLLSRRKLVTILFTRLLFTTRCIVLLFEPSVLLHP